MPTPSTTRTGLGAAPVLTLVLVLGPIAAGTAAVAAEAWSAEGWRRLATAPGIERATLATLASGLAATLLSLALVAGLTAAFHESRGLWLIRRLLGPLLSVPHAAMAIGLAFLIAPSGWLLRLASPWATGWTRPPDLALVQDPDAIALTLGLVVKETPFLFLMTLAALGQVDARRSILVARSLGYRPATAWLKVVWPRLYRQLRLPLFAVLAFCVSVVDMALILGPTAPPTLAVQITRWAGDPDPAVRAQGAAGAVLLLALTLVAIAGWLAGERLLEACLRGWRTGGGRGGGESPLRWIAGMAAALVVGAAWLALAGLALWAVADAWRFPDPLPTAWSVRRLGEAVAGAWRPLATTLGIGAVAAAVALALVVACLEHESRRRRPVQALWLLYLPLLVPQLVFLYGVQQLLVRLGIDGSWLAVAWVHLLFVLPYVFLSLSDPWRALDERYRRSAQALGASPGRVLRRITLPLLLRPVLVALAVGFAVSVAQYLPTLFAGAGRVETLTTEAVALAAGGDRRVVAVHALLQAVLPFLGFAAGLALPGWLWRGRAGMRTLLR